MNDIINTTQGAALTMSSREIADLTGKRHDHVMRDIRIMMQALGGLPNFGGTYLDGQGKEHACFNLPKRETLLLVSGYSVELRARIIDRLEDLESRHRPGTAPNLNDPSLLRHLLLENVEKVLALESKVEEMQHDVEALEHLTDATGTFSRTEAAKSLGIPPQILIRWMRTNGWIYRRAGAKEDLAYQSKMASGYLEHKVSTGPRPDGTEWISTQVRVTAKGLAVLAKAFPASARAA